MVRTQIQLTYEQATALKRIARRRGVSMATVVREAVDRELAGDDREAKIRRALAAVGSARSGVSDVAENHDRYLVEDYFAWRS